MATFDDEGKHFGNTVETGFKVKLKSTIKYPLQNPLIVNFGRLESKSSYKETFLLTKMLPYILFLLYCKIVVKGSFDHDHFQADASGKWDLGLSQVKSLNTPEEACSQHSTQETYIMKNKYRGYQFSDLRLFQRDPSALLQGWVFVTRSSVNSLADIAAAH